MWWSSSVPAGLLPSTPPLLPLPPSQPSPDIVNHVAAHHRLMAHWDALLPGRVMHLHYSDMVGDQEGTTRRLARHCGLPWHPNLLRFYETQRAVQTASQLQASLMVAGGVPWCWCMLHMGWA